MIRIFYRSFLSLTILLLIIIVYLTTIGIKTDKFNPKIISQVKQIEPNIDLRLNDVILTLDPFKFRINLKTIGTNLVYSNKKIGLETIKSKISLKSFLNDKFSLTEISISTKSLVIKDLITFIRLLNNDPKLFIAEKLIKRGYLVADIKLEFDDAGNIKRNFKFNGLVKDGKIDIFKKYNFNKIDFDFEIDQKILRFNKIKINLNGNNFSIPELIASKKNDEHLISGQLNTNNTILSKNEIIKIIGNEFLKLDVQEILFSSKNDFKFKINKNFKVENLEVKSDIDLDNLKLINFSELKKIFPKVKKDLIFKNQKINLKYKKDDLSIVGSGDILLQKEIDKIDYKIYKKNDEIEFETKLKILRNPFKIDFINFKKNIDSDLELYFLGKSDIKEKLLFNKISLREKNKNISIKNLILSKNNKIDDLGNISIDYIDNEGLKNSLELKKKR